jgi:Cdc6-like AAA superfamily ATPase
MVELYDAACARLSLEHTPGALAGREQESALVSAHIQTGLENKGSSSSLYVCGRPGTGKTVTTLQVIAKLRKKHNFDFLQINAMQLTSPNLVYTLIYERIVGRRVDPATAALFLDGWFKKKDKAKLWQGAQPTLPKGKTNHRQAAEEAGKMRVILLDELDAVVTKKQGLLYNLFDWPCHATSKLLVVAISNTLDLPEGMQAKIKSRVGDKRVVYPPYN